ncbi:MAG: MCE family protein [Flavisolibacter sp.]|nr:MCE family protein [Flavisolibacter sp.]
MKFSNEVKVGILAIAAILILVLGFNFLKGKSIFKRTPTIYAKFAKLGSLEKSNQVKINGLSIGTVYDFAPINKEVDGILVEIHLTRDISIPANSIAFIDGGPLASAFINIEKGNASRYLKSGDTITTRLDLSLLADLKTQLTPTLSRVNETLDTLRLAVGNISSIFDPNTNNNLQTIIARLTISSAHLQQLLEAERGEMAQSIRNVNAITGNLARNNEQVTQSIRNIEITTSKLANSRIQETVAALEGTINELKGTAAQAQTFVNRMNSNNGTLGLLMNDRKLHDQLDRAALALEILLDDVRVHPKRYVNISLFGGKGKPEPLTSPAVKDTALVISKNEP